VYHAFLQHNTVIGYGVENQGVENFSSAPYFVVISLIYNMNLRNQPDIQYEFKKYVLRNTKMTTHLQLVQGTQPTAHRPHAAHQCAAQVYFVILCCSV
jgi:hypothetical protein